VCPAEGLGDEVEARIRDVAVAAYRVMGCRDYARIDMRVDDKGQPFILEVNPNPDLADGSAYMMCAEQSGRSYAQTLLEITKMALSRGHVPEEPAEEARSASTDLMNRKYSKRPTPRACPKCGAALPHRSETAPPERAETAPNEPAKTGSTSA